MRPIRATRSSVTGPVSPSRLISNQGTSVEGSGEAKSSSETDSKAAEKTGDNSPPSDGESVQEIVISASQVNLGSEEGASRNSHSSSATVPVSPPAAHVEEERRVFSLDDSMEVDVPPVPDSTNGQRTAEAPPSVIDVDEEMLDGTAQREDTAGEEHKAPPLTTRVKDGKKCVPWASI